MIQYPPDLIGFIQQQFSNDPKCERIVEAHLLLCKCLQLGGN